MPAGASRRVLAVLRAAEKEPSRRGEVGRRTVRARCAGEGAARVRAYCAALPPPQCGATRHASRGGGFMCRMRGALMGLVGSGNATRWPPANTAGLYASGILGCITGLFR
mmetsp:Transcript_60503/g.156998  ORF Transcript_60503/g.156998 Transcript_60503/m.156998 type:complete len:110 (-) Transcript_60503:277-606(-)